MLFIQIIMIFKVEQLPKAIHTGVMAATLNTSIMAYAGVDIRQDILTITLHSSTMAKLSFKLLHRSTLYQINLIIKKLVFK